MNPIQHAIAHNTKVFYGRAHDTLDLEELTQAFLETVLALVGHTSAAVYVGDREKHRLLGHISFSRAKAETCLAMDMHGADLFRFAEASPGDGVCTIRDVVETIDVAMPLLGDRDDPIGIFPFTTEEGIEGLIVIWRDTDDYPFGTAEAVRGLTDIYARRLARSTMIIQRMERPDEADDTCLA